MDNTQSQGRPTVIKFNPVAALISFSTWLALVAAATLAFSLLAGRSFPDAKIWLILVPTAALLAVFSSFVQQVSRSRI